MSNFSASFTYEGIDQLSPVLDKIIKLSKKLETQSVKAVKKYAQVMASSQAKAEKSVLNNVDAQKKLARETVMASAKSARAVRKSTSLQTKAYDKVILKSKELRRTQARQGRAKPSMGGGGAGGIGVTPDASGVFRSVAIPYVATVTAVVLAGSKLEGSMASLQAITGVSDSALKSMKLSIQDLAMTYGVSSSSIAKGMEAIGSKQPELLKTPAMLLKVTETAVLMSKASGRAFEDTSDALVNVMNQYDLTGDSAMRVANLLASAEQLGSVNVGKISEAMVQAGTASKVAGVSLEENIAIMDVLGKAGIEGARAGTALRSMYNKMSVGADKFNPQAVGTAVALENISKMTKQQRLKMFGEEYSNVAKIMSDGTEKAIKFSVAIQGNNTVAEQAKINMKTFGQAMKRFKEKAVTALEEAFVVLKPHLVFFGGMLSDMATATVKWVRNNPLLVKTLFAIGGTATVILGLASAFIAVKLALLSISLVAMPAVIASMAPLLPFLAVIGVAVAAITFGTWLDELLGVSDALSEVLSKMGLFNDHSDTDFDQAPIQTREQFNKTQSGFGRTATDEQYQAYVAKQQAFRDERKGELAGSTNKLNQARREEFKGNVTANVNVSASEGSQVDGVETEYDNISPRGRNTVGTR